MIAARARALIASSIAWDNHACMPLRPDDEAFLPSLQRHKEAGFTAVSLNIGFDLLPWHDGFRMLASFRNWIATHGDDYCLAETARDIERAKRDGKLAIFFDLEGGCAVEPHIGLVEIFYRLGVRWMLIAYNRNNGLGGGCQDDDHGLTDFGRTVIDAMNSVGMLVCCSHSGPRTALEVIEHSQSPAIFSHSNASAVWPHSRNIADELVIACARKGGVINLSGYGPFLGDNDNSTEQLIRHVDHVAGLVGAAHVGLGLDYVFDLGELAAFKTLRPDLYPPALGYRTDVALVEPERLPAIVEALLRRGYSDAAVQGIIGHNNLRLAREVWK